MKWQRLPEHTGDLGSRTQTRKPQKKGPRLLRLRVECENRDWLVVDKPHGFHTHPPEDKSLRIHPRWNALGILERQLGLAIYPMHRLDRAASGLLLYSKNREWNSALQQQFQTRDVNKIYYILVRGEIAGDIVFTDPLESEAGNELPAITKARSCFSFELPIPHPRGGFRRFTFLEVRPETGRFHQIRRHFARAGFPLIGDSRHGDRKLNRAFAEHSGCHSLFLRCMELSFTCPRSKERITTKARWSREWHRLFEVAGACPLTERPPKSKQILPT